MGELEQTKRELIRIRDNPNLLKVDDTASSTPIANKRNRYLQTLETFWDKINNYVPNLEYPTSNEKAQLFILSPVQKIIEHKIVSIPFPSIRDGTVIREFLTAEPYSEIEGKLRPIRPDELRQRLTILEKSIRIGQLDDILNDPPEKTITRIMGYTGELLERIGVKPEEGATYRELSAIRKNTAQGKKIENNHAHESQT